MNIVSYYTLLVCFRIHFLVFKLQKAINHSIQNVIMEYMTTLRQLK